MSVALRVLLLSALAVTALPGPAAAHPESECKPCSQPPEPSDTPREPAAKPTLGDFFVEYSRGFSTETSGDLMLKYDDTDYTFHAVAYEDRSFYPDNGVIPNAFLVPLGNGDIVAAVKATTEPYYGIRLFYFFLEHPDWGVGLDFIHFKVFLDIKQTARVTGTEAGQPIDEQAVVNDRVPYFNISHGVNHLSLAVAYRRRLFPNEDAPEGQLQPFVSLAAGPAIPHTEIKLRDANGVKQRRAYSFQFGFPNFGIGMALGTRWHFSKHWGTYLEYKYTYSYLHDMFFDDGTEGTIQTSFTDHHLQWGISLIF